ncbi:MAG: hypothetical protein LUG60_14205 [Erysipelotrichaceae bacterium]|nr:hypothetical protein [Erysipelotrichaceae bacterium]
MKNKSYINAIIIGCIFVINQLYVKMASQNAMILVSIFPILITYLITYINGKTKNISEFMMDIFSQKEKTITLIFAIVCIGLYYTICIILENNDFSNIEYVVLLCYIPWIMLQGNLVELDLNEKG